MLTTYVFSFHLFLLFMEDCFNWNVQFQSGGKQE